MRSAEISVKGFVNQLQAQNKNLYFKEVDCTTCFKILYRIKIPTLTAID